MPGAGLDYRHRPGRHGNGRRRDGHTTRQRLLENPGPVRQSHEANQRRRSGGHPKAPAHENRRGRAGSGGDLSRPSPTISEPCSILPTAPRPTETSRTGIISFAVTRSFPTSSRYSKRPFRICRSTTPSRASTVRWANAPCWACSSRWRSVSQIAKQASWRPSI